MSILFRISRPSSIPGIFPSSPRYPSSSCSIPTKKSRNRLLCYGITRHLAFPRLPTHPTPHISSCSFHSSGTSLNGVQYIRKHDLSIIWMSNEFTLKTGRRTALIRAFMGKKVTEPRPLLVFSEFLVIRGSASPSPLSQNDCHVHFFVFLKYRLDFTHRRMYIQR